MKLITKLLLLSAISGIFTGNLSADNHAGNIKSKAIDTIVTALNSSDTYYRVRGIEVVADSEYKPLMPMVVKLLADDYRPVRFAAALAVGDMNYYRAREKLKKLFQVGDKYSRVAAAYALVKLGDKSYIQTVRQALSSEDQKLKSNAAMLLGKLKDNKSLDKLQKVFVDQKASDAAMFQAAEAIARIYNSCIDSRGRVRENNNNCENITNGGYRAIYQRLWTLLISKHPDDRKFGVQAMASLATIEARQAVLTMLYDENLEVRLVAALELGKMGDNSGQIDIIDIMTKPLEQIDVEAMERAYEYGQKDKAKNSEENDKNEKKPVFTPVNRTEKERRDTLERGKTLAALAIGHIKTDSVVKFLPQLLRNDSPQVSIAAAQSVLMINK